MFRTLKKYWSYFFLLLVFFFLIRQFNLFFEKKIIFKKPSVQHFHKNKFDSIIKYLKQTDFDIIRFENSNSFSNFKGAVLVLEFSDKKVFLNSSRKVRTVPGDDYILLKESVRFSDKQDAIFKYWYKIPNDGDDFFQNYRIIYYLGSLFIFGLLIMNFIDKYKFDKKMEKINQILKDFLVGDFSARFEVKKDDELSFTLSSFNYLIEKLRQRIDEIGKKSGELEIINNEKTVLLEKINNFNKELHHQVQVAVQKYQETNDALESNVIELKNLKILNENIFSSIASGVLTVDRNGKILFLNDEALKVFDIVHQEDIEGKEVFEVFGEYTEFIYYFKRILDAKIKVIRDICIEIKEKDKFIGMNLSLLTNYKGEVEGCVGIFNDITQNILLREQVNRSKVLSSLGQIAAGVAHEIRNPLGAIKGFVELIEEDVIGTRNEKYIKKLLSEVDNINEIVSAILNYSSLKLPNFQDHINLGKIMNKSLEALAHRMKKINLKVEGNGKKIYHRVDPLQIQQIFMNLINNAIDSMNSSGDLEITIADEEKYIEVKFKDSGCGINSNDLEKVFIPFFTTKQFGTGLGLAIVSRIIENHNGAVQIESELGKGSCFIINFNKEYYRF
ncbi:PAS domain-containing protein [bacterium]|nr:PAS domain-containing protein [bacterium]